ncbi:MAG TPA: hypothetical protein VMM92_12120, partial [Thermoanaerobaculia bacterium]|nr:hypothetical protein [Thermoanaerobaculia bacterium]
LPAEEAASLAETAREAGYENLLRLLHQLLQSEATVRRSETGALAVEIAWLRAAELPKLRRVEELLAGTATGASPATPRAAVKAAPAAAARSPRLEAAPRPAPVRPAAAAPAPPPPVAVGEPAQPADVSTAADVANIADIGKIGDTAGIANVVDAAPEIADLSDLAKLMVAPPATPPARPVAAVVAVAAPGAVAPAGAAVPPVIPKSSSPVSLKNGDPIDAFRDEVSRLKQPLLAYLEHAEALRFGERGLEILCPPGDTWIAGHLKRGNNWQVLREAAAAVWGPDTAVELAEGSGQKPESPAAIAGVKLELVAENPTIQTVLDIFQGRVEKVEEHRSGLRED